MGADDQAEADGVGADVFEVAPGEWGMRTELRDGTAVLLRQIRPSDRERLAEGLQQLSPASRHLRFHTDVDELTDRQLDYLTRVDHRDHEAIVAIDLDNPEVPGIGVARYIRDAYEREVAEAAVTVADVYQGRGAGTLLLGAIGTRAREHGIEVFRNYVLADNDAMLEVFDQLGATREVETPGLWRVDLPVPDESDDLPDTPARQAFLTAARSGFRLSSLSPPVWCHLPFRVSGSDELARGIEAELATLRDELGPWLAERQQRTAAWPDDD